MSDSALKRLTPIVKESESSPMREMMKMMEEKKGLLSLSAGEARFEAPPELIELAVQAMQSGKNLYTSTNGIPQIREALAASRGLLCSCRLFEHRTLIAKALQTPAGRRSGRGAGRLFRLPGRGPGEAHVRLPERSHRPMPRPDRRKLKVARRRGILQSRLRLTKAKGSSAPGRGRSH